MMQDLISLLLLSSKTPENLKRILDSQADYKQIGEILVFIDNKELNFSYSHPKVKILSSTDDFGSRTRWKLAQLAKYPCLVFQDDDILLGEQVFEVFLKEVQTDDKRAYALFGRNPTLGNYYNARSVQETAEMVLTRAAAIHRDVVPLIFDQESRFNKAGYTLPPSGEDIFLSYCLSAHFGKIHRILNLPHTELRAGKSRWVKPQNFEERTKVLRDCKEFFGTNSASVKHREEMQLEAVRNYYDQTSGLYLTHGGPFFQAGLVAGFDGDQFRSTALHIIQKAGIAEGARILDMGCGIGGPAMEICRCLQEVKIDGITLSPEQLHLALGFVEAEGLADRINLVLGDYHDLPYPDDAFDVVMFLESAGHSYDLAKLFCEAKRVLRPGGRIYIKDVFCVEGNLNVNLREELRKFEVAFHYLAAPCSVFMAELKAAGFDSVEKHFFKAPERSDRIQNVTWEKKGGVQVPTEFARAHAPLPSKPPILFGEVTGVKKTNS